MPDAPTRASGAGVLREAIADCLRLDDPSVGRLGYADTSVRLHVADGEAITLLLAESGPELADDSADTEIEIELTDQQARDLVDGSFAINTALISGDVEASGPVRKYMEVDPMLRRLILAAQGAEPPGKDLGEPAPEGRDSTEHDIPSDRLAIETKDLHKAFGPARILRGCNLTIPEGVISVILGPSGTGKSVMLQHIIGLLEPDKGDVVIRGNPLSEMSRNEILSLRREIGVMFQDGALFSTMNVFDNTAFPLRQHTNLDESQVTDIVESRLAEVGLSGAAGRMPGQLSGGMRKRAGLARALVLDPGIVLCDEPDSGLDPVRTSLLGDLLVEQHAEHGGTMIVVTHNVPLAKQISDHVSVLWRGEVVESGLSRDVFASDHPFIRQFLRSDTDGPLSMDA